MLVALATGSSAGAAEKARTELRVRSAAPDAGRVAESYVSIRAPLPASDPAHPAACDRLGYLRFRDPKGPRRASAADAVVVAMPGFLSGASPLDQLGRNFVRRMASRGRHVEFWALDRRANCLEDHRGIDAAARSHDPKIAYDYYWHGQPIDGVSFGGWKTASETQWLKDMGLAQTVRDWYTVLTKEIPDQGVRRRKVFCGGHSLGGPITTAFAGWDFDGNPATTSDAGYEQCAGFFGLDTSLGFGGSSGSSAGVSDALASASGGSPFVSAPPFTPETLEVPEVFGVGAFFEPQRTNLIQELPHSNNIDLSQRVLFSRNAANFATGSPSIRDFHLTNETALGGIFDDNSEPITILRASLGTSEGGPVAQKDFPGASTPLTNNDFLMIPSDTKAPLYRWREYNRLDEKGAPVQVNDKGQRYTSAKSEKSDLHQFARTTFEAPADFVEQYFPTRLLVDSEDAGNGDRSGSLADLRYDGIAKRPSFLIEAGDSESNSGANPRTTPRAGPPNSSPLSGVVTLPGYNHIDVTAAAWRQNDGRPEGSSSALSNFSCRVLGICAPACLARRTTVGPRGIGRVRLGRTRARLRLLPGLARVTRRSFRYCVKGGGSVRAAFSARGRAALVATTARGHRKRGLHRGSRARALRRAFPHRRRLGRGLYRAGRRSRLLIGVRHGRVTFLASAAPTLLRHPRVLKRYLRYAGVR